MTTPRAHAAAEETTSLYCREHFEDILHNLAVDDIDRSGLMKKFAAAYLKHLRMIFGMIPTDINNQNKKILIDVFTCIKSLYANFDLYSASIFHNEILHNGIKLAIEMPDIEEREAFINQIELILKKYQGVMRSFQQLTFLPREDFSYEMEICPGKITFTCSRDPGVASIETETASIMQKAYGFSLKGSLEDQFTALSLCLSALKTISSVPAEFKNPELVTTIQIYVIDTFIKLSERVFDIDRAEGFAYICKAVNLLRHVVNYPYHMIEQVNEIKSRVLRCQIIMQVSLYTQTTCTHARHIRLLQSAENLSATIPEPTPIEIEMRKTIISSLALTFCRFGIYFAGTRDFKNALTMIKLAFETNKKLKELNLTAAVYQVSIATHMLNLLTALSVGASAETHINNLMIFRQQLSWIPDTVINEDSVIHAASHRLLCVAYLASGRKELDVARAKGFFARAKINFKQAKICLKLIKPAVKFSADFAMEQSVSASLGETILMKLKFKLETDDELHYHPFVRQEKINKVMLLLAKVHPLNKELNVAYAAYLKNIAVLINDIASTIDNVEEIFVSLMLKAILVMRYSIERSTTKDLVTLLSFQKQLLSYAYHYIQTSEKPPHDDLFKKYCRILRAAYSELKKIAKDDLNGINKYHLDVIKNELRMLRIFDVDFIEMTLSALPVSKPVSASFFKPSTYPQHQSAQQDGTILKDLANPGFLPSIRMALLTIMNRTRTKPKNQNDIVESVYNITRIDKLLKTPALQPRRFSI